jgi:transcriptional regulator with XRE-family HTH domain
VTLETSINVPDAFAETTASTLAAIGVRIREVRLARGLTLQALSSRSGLSPSMLSLVERGRASPSIGSLIVIVNSLGVTMTDIMPNNSAAEESLVVRATDQPLVETAQHVIRRIIRDDRSRGISIAINEYEPHTGNAEHPVTHDGFEYGFVLEGTLTVEVDGTTYVLKSGDLISYSSRRPHKMWNHGKRKVRTLWFNLIRE